ncbi:MAG: hypothetical protein AMXMBFR84_38220 [Candidatus Hydrogenedentota bacterium]
MKQMDANSRSASDSTLEFRLSSSAIRQRANLYGLGCALFVFSCILTESGDRYYDSTRYLVIFVVGVVVSLPAYAAAFHYMTKRMKRNLLRLETTRLKLLVFGREQVLDFDQIEQVLIHRRASGKLTMLKLLPGIKDRALILRGYDNMGLLVAALSERVQSKSEVIESIESRLAHKIVFAVASLLTLAGVPAIAWLGWISGDIEGAALAVCVLIIAVLTMAYVYARSAEVRTNGN